MHLASCSEGQSAVMVGPCWTGRAATEERRPVAFHVNFDYYMTGRRAKGEGVVEHVGRGGRGGCGAVLVPRAPPGKGGRRAAKISVELYVATMQEGSALNYQMP